MEVNRFDHICIAVKDLKAAQKIWEPILGKSAPDESYVHDPEKIRVARYWIGGVGFELMESTTPEGPVAEWIRKNGEGLMLISFNVDNTRASVAALQDRDYQFIPDRKGEVARSFRNGEFALMHPKHLNGVLTELIDCGDHEPSDNEVHITSSYSVP
jgi:methylmalonyl-CoA/ethylmalonyl-CoA epimerase